MPTPHTSPPAACFACQADTSALSPDARYCPQCGTMLAAGDHVIRAEETHPLEPEYWSVRKEIDGHLADYPPPPPASSMIMLAYANAMLNVGLRSAAHNREEADRCYAKARRLSQAWGRR